VGTINIRGWDRSTGPEPEPKHCERMNLALAQLFNFEKKLIQTVLHAQLAKSHILVAVSGGADSLALATGLVQIRHHLKGLSISWAHVHHGDCEDRLEHVTRLSAVAGVPLVIARLNPPSRESSESVLRQLRYERLSELAISINATVIATGHTQDDVIETRLIRLFRGVGPKGFTALRTVRGNRFRPLLGVTRNEVEIYLQSKCVEWMEDPSNGETGNVRNWLRHKWLAPLRHERPTSWKGLAQSLSRIAADLEHYDQLIEAYANDVTTNEGLVRQKFNALDPRIQRGVVAHYVRQKVAAEWTREQIEEVHKRVLSPRRAFQFHVGGHEWIISPDSIRVTATDSP
jgi:tRNA(Ile)-lysidine synthase